MEKRKLLQYIIDRAEAAVASLEAEKPDDVHEALADVIATADKLLHAD